MKRDNLIHESESIKSALKKIDRSKDKVLLVVDKADELRGTITDGDVRRYILRGKSLDDSIRDLYNRKPAYLRQDDYSVQAAKRLFIQKDVDLIPLTDQGGRVIDVITREQVFTEGDGRALKGTKLRVPVVIMAGGKGSRLEPFSKILPKPLVPIGEKPVIEIIIEEFVKQGLSKYYVTLGYKGKMIESYFDSIEKDYEIRYVWDNETSGTIGSLKLVEKDIDEACIVSNCDVMVKADFRDVLNLHKKRNASLTVLSSVQHHKIPYGVVTIGKGGEIEDMVEKPEYTFMINTGVYVVSKDALRFIPDSAHFDMTDLIRALLDGGKRVATYPVNESDYIDIGQWEEYKKNLQKFNEL